MFAYAIQKYHTHNIPFTFIVLRRMVMKQLHFALLFVLILFVFLQSVVAQIDLRQIHSFACEITGISIEDNVSNEDFDLIHEALLFCKVLVIRGQSNLSVEKQRVFSKRFGKLHVHLESASHYQGYEDVNCVSNIKNENGNYMGLYGRHVEEFHSDLSWAPIPSKITIVKSQILPKDGGCGDTEFLDSSSAYAMLSDEMKELLQGVQAKYCYLKHRTGEETIGLSPTEVEMASQCAIHPIVTVHPITGLANLFANPSHTMEILPFSTPNSTYTTNSTAQLLDEVFGWLLRAETPRYVHVWRAGDVLLWDNRAVQHRATRGCPDSVPRLLVRTTVQGDSVPREVGSSGSGVVEASGGLDLQADRIQAQTMQ